MKDKLLRFHRTGLWNHPDFMKLWGGQTVSVFGSLVTRMALPWTAILVLNISDAGPMALLQAADLIPGLILGVVAGVFIDRVRRRPVMIVADLGRALMLGSIPVAAAMHQLTMLLLYIVALVVSALTLFFDVAYGAYLPTLIGRSHLVEGNSKLHASAAVAEVSAFGLGGVLVQTLTAPIAILLDAFSFLVSFASIALIRKPESHLKPTHQETATTARQDMVEGMRLLIGHPTLRALGGATCTVSLSRSVVGVVLLLFWTNELHLGTALQGGLSAVGGVSSLLAALVAGRVLLRWKLGTTLVRSLLLDRLTTFLLALAGGPLWLVLAMLTAAQVFGDSAATLYEINQASLVQSSLPDRVQGRVQSGLRTLEWGGMLLGLAIGGALGDLVGLRTTLLIAAIIGLPAPLWIALSPVHQLRGFPSNETPGEAI